jgi:GH15 family glucan-1,4-alpha-glucosidase
MKRIFITIFLLTVSLFSFSQTCEERENKLLEGFVGFSAGMLYNTYGLIGSISDGYTHDAYDAVMVSDLMDAQKKVADNLVKVLEELKNGGFLKDKKDQDFTSSVINILKGLKKQAQLLEDYADNKSKQKQDAYEDQRKQNWSAISKLMGIEE